MKVYIRYIVQLLTLCLFPGVTEGQGKVCSSIAGSTLSSSDPKRPTLPDSYQTALECNIIDKGYTQDSQIYYDYPGNRATINYFARGLEGQTIYSYNTNEVFYILDGTCTVQSLNGTSDSIVFGQETQQGQIHIGHPAASYSFGQSYAEKYLGNTTKRGIPVQHWQSCTYSSVTKMDLRIDYYFSVNWSPSSVYISVPVLVEVQGTKQYPNNTLYNIHHTYDYYNFKPDLEVDPYVFQTKKGVICPGRKAVRPPPTLPNAFSYRTEEIFEDVEAIRYTSTWYDAGFNFFRMDYRPLFPQWPAFTIHPLTEIHDYNTGVRYVIDKSFGNCTVLPLTNLSIDTISTISASKSNGSYYYHIKHPAQLFRLDWNYTYVGQSVVRNINCDVFVSRQTNAYVSDFVSNGNITITFYFMADGWKDIVDDGEMQNIFATPVKMELYDEEVGLTATYNYLDFDADVPNLDLFDISACYKDTQKVKFTVQFPGVFLPTSGPTMLEWAHLTFAQQMAVSPLRIQNVMLDYDDAAIYISATLLDKTPATPQFTYVPGKDIQRQDDSVVYNVIFPMQCATFCINNAAFTCNSFAFCGNQHLCRLSRAHIGDPNTAIANSTNCDHFSRDVNGPPTVQPSVTDAFHSLQQKVYNSTLKLSHNLDRTYTAVDVKINFGWENTKVKIPKIAKHFYYRAETAIPTQKLVYSGNAWYDTEYKLLRYDVHYNTQIAPYYTTDPLTIVHDFNTGLQYMIDRVYGNCSVGPIPQNSPDSQSDQSAAAYVLSMKTSQHLLYLDDTYRFVGQKTVRGMPCNVFESERTDFVFPTTNQTTDATFKYYFLADGWLEETDQFGQTSNQPIMLEITVLEFNFYMVTNLYDYSEMHPDLSVFDVHKCYELEQQHPFQVTFPGNYYTDLQYSSKSFVIEAVFQMAKIANVSILRFQQTELTYDSSSIYINSVLLGTVHYHLFFSEIRNGSVVQTPDNSLDGVTSEEQCASLCIEKDSYICNSFYFCQQQNKCLLSRNHVPENTTAAQIKGPGCSAFTRTVDGKAKHALSKLQAYINLKNSVYTGQFNVDVIKTSTNQVKQFTASSIQDDVNRPDVSSQENVDMQHFTVFGHDQSLASADVLLDNMAVDDCAVACYGEQTINCLGFTYCYNTFTCALSSKRPTSAAKKVSCDVFSRTYLDDYIPSPGSSMKMIGYKTVPNIASSGDCSRLCSDPALKCRSFQYCQTTKECVLFNQRTGGLSWATATSSTTQTLCLQYRRRVIKDFQLVSGQVLKFARATLEIVGVSLSQCAQLCVDNQGTGCTGFYHCGNTTICHLTGAKPGSSQVTVSNDNSNDYCSYYSRQYYSPTVSPPTDPSQRTPKLVSTKMTTGTSTLSSSTAVKNLVPTPQSQQVQYKYKNEPGAMVGVAFALFVVGLVAGVVSLHFYRRYKGVDRDGMKANFVHERTNSL